MKDELSKDHEMEVLAEMGKLTSDLEDTVSSGIAIEAAGPETAAAAAPAGNIFAATSVPATRAGGRASRSAHNRARRQAAAAEERAAEKAAEKAEKRAAKKASKKSPKKGSGKDSGDDGNGKNGKKKKRLYISIWKMMLVFILLGLAVGGIAVAMAISYAKSVVEDTPEIKPENIYDLLTENSVLNDSDGNLIEYIYSGDSLRTNIEYKDMPEVLVNAFVCIEDKTFWEHHGINYVRIIGAIVDSLRRDVRISGTSTITQQLSRNLYLSEIKSQRSLERKLQEIYYTFIIENALSKQQILEAYLNTIYLGYNSNGVAAAAQAYFSKDVKDLGLVECAILASLPQSPNNFAPIKRIATESIENPEDYDIISSDDQWTIVYNDAGESRVKLVLRLMHEQGKIDDAQYNAAVNAKFRSFINPGESIMSSYTSSYFADYVVAEVLDDLQSELGLTEDEARNYLYNNGLIINSTLDKRVQDIMETTYSDLNNFPAVGSYSKDKDGNILDENGKILLYNMDELFGEPEEDSIKTYGDFTLQPDEFEWLGNGDLKLFGGKRLNFYKTSVQGNIDYSIEFKNMFETAESEEGKKLLFSRSGGVWNIAADYKNRDDNGDLTIKASYFEDKPEAFTKNEDGSLTLSNSYFTLRQQVLQPQSAMVIIDFKTGQILGMIGGRGLEGKLLYNRATSPRQPGSSIKPLAVYSVALEEGYLGMGNFTAATPIDDAPIALSHSPWPKNWYSGYKGMTNLRNAVEQSINACAVNLYMQLDQNMCVQFLQNMGVSTLVTSGSVNDLNASALALGGMTRGISPLEMAAAYSTFGNDGIYTEPSSYTTVTNKKGEVLLEKNPDKTQVMDLEVASLMLDILHTTVTKGLGSRAKLSSQPSAGKTGTTSDRYDIWFCGLTPQVAASVWIGNDVNISLSTGSDAAATLWAKVMDQVGALYERGEFELKGNFVSRTVDRHSGKLMSELSGFNGMNCALSEIFIAGTEPSETDDSHVTATVCAATGYLATPYCTNTVSKVFTIRPGGMSWEKMVAVSGFKNLNVESIKDAIYDLPEYYCPLHNPSADIYPINPSGRSVAVYNPNHVEPLEPEVPTDSAIDVPGVVTGGAIDPYYVDPMYNDDETTGGQGQTGGQDASAGSDQTQGQQPVEGGEGQAPSEGGETPDDGSGAGTQNPDDGITVWDDNALSEDPNY